MRTWILGIVVSLLTLAICGVDCQTSLTGGGAWNCNTTSKLSVLPVLECVRCANPNDNPTTCTHLLATFGYQSCNPCSVNISIGSDNFISNGFPQIQPSVFQPGYNPASLVLPINRGQTATWSVRSLPLVGYKSASVTNAVPGQGLGCSGPVPSAYRICSQPCDSACSNLYVPYDPAWTTPVLTNTPICTCGCADPTSLYALVVAGCRNTSMGGNVAKYLANQGYKVVVTARKPQACSTDIVNTPGITVFPYPVNVLVDSDVKGLFQYLKQMIPRLDVVLSVPGLGYFGATQQASPVTVEQVVANNFLGHVRVVYYANQVWNNTYSNSTKFILWGSTASEAPVAGEGIYSVSKFAVRGFVENYNLDNQLFGLNGYAKYPAIVMVEPGAINTTFGQFEWFTSDYPKTSAPQEFFQGDTVYYLTNYGDNPYSVVGPQIYNLAISPSDCLNGRYAVYQLGNPVSELAPVTLSNQYTLSQPAQLQYNVESYSVFAPGFVRSLQCSDT